MRAKAAFAGKANASLGSALEACGDLALAASSWTPMRSTYRLNVP
jgi:hypothetical protein